MIKDILTDIVAHTHALGFLTIYLQLEEVTIQLKHHQMELHGQRDLLRAYTEDGGAYNIYILKYSYSSISLDLGTTVRVSNQLTESPGMSQLLNLNLKVIHLAAFKQ